MATPDIKLLCQNSQGETLLSVNQTSGTFCVNLIQSNSTNGNYTLNNPISSNSTTGGLVTYGGMSIANTTNASSVSVGGAMTIAGGMSVNNDILMGGLLNGTTLSTGSLGSSISTGNIQLSGNITVGGNLVVLGTTTVVNETIANLTDTNITASSVYITNGLHATFNSNTLGNIFTTGGNVGIGTGTPVSKLDVISSNSNGNIFLGTNVQNKKLVLYDGFNNNNQFYGLGVNDLALRYQVDSTITDHVFYAATSATASNELFRIKGTGDIIVAGTANAVSISTGNMFCSNLTTGTSVITNGLNAVFNSNTIGNIFTTNGNVGIGTTSPISNLDVRGTGNVQISVQSPSAQILLYSASGSNINYIQSSGDINFTAISSAVVRTLYLATSGNVGIGTASPTSTLDVSGTARFTTSLTTANVYSTNITSTNSVFTNGTINNILVTSLSAGSSVITNSTLSNSLCINSTVTNLVGNNATISSILSSTIITNNLFFTSVTGANSVLTNTSIATLNVTGSTTTNALTTNQTITNSIITSAIITNGTLSNLYSNNTTIGSGFATSLNVSNLITTTSTIPSLVTINATMSSLVVSAGLTTGNINFTGNLYQNGALYISSQWTGTTGTSLFYGSTGSVNIGIGTTNPQYTLDVNGSSRFVSGISTGTLAVTNNLNMYSSVFLNTYGSYLTNDTTSGLIFNSTIQGPSLYGKGGGMLGYNGSTNVLSWNSGGNVGINTTNQIYSLDINGRTRVNNTTTLTNNTNINLVSGGSLNVAGDIVFGGMEHFNNSLAVGPPTFTTRSVGTRSILYPNISASTFDYSIGVDSSALWLSSPSSLKMYSNSTTPTLTIIAGSVGINTTSPGNTLDIVGTGRFTTSITTAALYSTNVTSTNAVLTNSTISNMILTNVSASNNILTNALVTNFTGTNLTVTNQSVSSLSVSTSTFGSLLTTNTFSANYNSNTIGGTIFTTGGNVGVNTTSPAYKLDIKGITRINDTTLSSNSTTGTLISLGGVSITGTNSSSSTSGGGLTVAGGISVSQDTYLGGNLFIQGINSSVITGLTTVGSVSSTGVYQMTITIGKTMQNTTYKVIGNLSTTTSNTNVYTVSFTSLTTTTFVANVVSTYPMFSGWIDPNLSLSWVVYP